MQSTAGLRSGRRMAGARLPSATSKRCCEAYIRAMSIRTASSLGRAFRMRWYIFSASEKRCRAMVGQGQISLSREVIGSSDQLIFDGRRETTKFVERAPALEIFTVEVAIGGVRRRRVLHGLECVHGSGECVE